jgi:hypothetical protein
MRTMSKGCGGWLVAAGVVLGLSGCGGGSGPSHASNGVTQDGGPGGAGGGGNTALGHCDMTKESSTSVITQACGDVITPTGTALQLGPYGAMMDVNVGVGFENPDPADSATCPGFVAIFKEDPKISQQLLDVGPQPCATTTPNTGNCLNMQLYTVYRPANWPSGKIPVLSWGNGTCAQPEGYGTLLRYIASQGFFVIAANSREVGDGTALTHALDYAAKANEDPSSPYYGHLDMSKVGVMGHSQGSQAAGKAAADSRVQAAILFNIGDTAPKPYLAISGDLDVTNYTAQQMATAINGQSEPAAYLYYHNPAGNTADNLRGHLVLMLTPERVMDVASAYWKMTLLNDQTARNMFVGANCGLCGHSSDYDYGEHGL